MTFIDEQTFNLLIENNIIKSLYSHKNFTHIYDRLADKTMGKREGREEGMGMNRDKRQEKVLQVK